MQWLRKKKNFRNFSKILNIFKILSSFVRSSHFFTNVSVFLLSENLEVDPMRLNLLPTCEYMAIFLVKSELISPWKRLLSFAYLPVCFFSRWSSSSFACCCFCKNFAPYDADFLVGNLSERAGFYLQRL